MVLSSRARYFALGLFGTTVVVLIALAIATGDTRPAIVRAAQLLGTPAERRARNSIVQITFVRGRTLIQNELRQLFASDDGGESWHALAGGSAVVAVANGDELWGVQGWRGIHERASASVATSRDLGESWSTRDAILPPHRDGLFALLPSSFVNEPDAAPLVLMSDLHLARPGLTTDFTTWTPIGEPVPTESSADGTVHPVHGLQHGRSIYVAVGGAIYLSNDKGVTWSTTHVHAFEHASLRCRDTTCYALLSLSGSAWSGLMRVQAGSNDWTLVRSFEVEALAPILTRDGEHTAVSSFAAAAMVVTDDGVLVAGSVGADRGSWGVVLRVTDAGTTMVGHGVSAGLQTLEQDPDGTLWAGGAGVYRLRGDTWRPI